MEGGDGGWAGVGNEVLVFNVCLVECVMGLYTLGMVVVCWCDLVVDTVCKFVILVCFASDLGGRLSLVAGWLVGISSYVIVTKKHYSTSLYRLRVCVRRCLVNVMLFDIGGHSTAVRRCSVKMFGGDTRRISCFSPSM